ncbi:DUF5683 domain-containing protein [Alloprevotella sp. OH1205_COT-284]|uniref:DUF5683 domain-containing protein n=1 Tax=Alloprevotella sp. OH1205_COT-284 TaxID=2491043 RepID=UPI001F34C4B2|nr:DUF5683 domain-containing protein [Alloprevotella sp. OH1205_COT-284]
MLNIVFPRLRLIARTTLFVLATASAFGQKPAVDTLVTAIDTLPVATDTTAVEGERNAERLNNLATPADTTVFSRPIALIDNDRHRFEKAARQTVNKVFVPDPQRALWLSLVVPGAGQIYNRKYWKLPIVYGGFLGCTYAFLWNQQMYLDYSQAYLDIMDSDPTTNSYRNMFPPTYDIEGRIEQFKGVFKNRKDRYRRWRDLSAFCFIGVYLLSVVDAYVDAQLSVFDISPDLSLRLSPTVFDPHDTAFFRTPAFGLGASLTF